MPATTPPSRRDPVTGPAVGCGRGWTTHDAPRGHLHRCTRDQRDHDRSCRCHCGAALDWRGRAAASA